MNYKISDILELAADCYLKSGPDDISSQTTQYSCNAIEWVIYEEFENLVGADEYWREALELRINVLLGDLGLPSIHGSQFRDLESQRYLPTEESQSARYIWLKLVAEFARSEGL